MTTSELQQPSAKVRVAPAEDEGASAYGPVEIAWYPDRLEITALGAGRASISEGQAGDQGGDVVVEIRPPALDDLPETVPGAD